MYFWLLQQHFTNCTLKLTSNKKVIFSWVEICWHGCKGKWKVCNQFSKQIGQRKPKTTQYRPVRDAYMMKNNDDRSLEKWKFWVQDSLWYSKENFSGNLASSQKNKMVIKSAQVQVRTSKLNLRFYKIELVCGSNGQDSLHVCSELSTHYQT